MGNFSPKKFIHLQQGFLILCASCYFFSISSSPAFLYAFHFSLNNDYCSMKEIDQDTLWNIWCVCNLVFPIPTSSHPMALRFHHQCLQLPPQIKNSQQDQKKTARDLPWKEGEKRKILDRGSAEVPMNKSTTTTRGQRGSYLLLVSKYVQSRKRGFFWCSMASNNVVACYSTTASAAAVQILGKNEKNWSFPWSSSLVPTWI